MGFSIDLGDLVVHIKTNADKFSNEMTKASRIVDNAQRTISRAATKMSLAVSLPLTALATKAVKDFTTFDSAMTKSAAIMDDMSDNMRTKLETTALTMSGESVTAAHELADAYFFLTSAGFDVKQSLQSLEHVQKFAVAGMFDMARATDLLTDAQSAMGLTVDGTAKNTENLIHVSDVLVKANTLANATVEQFSRSLTAKAGASLKVMNKSVEEGVAVLAAFADQGVKAELGGERLAIVIRDIQNASLGKGSLPPWEEFGISAWTAAGKMRPLVDIIETLEGHLKGMSDRTKKATLSMLGFQERTLIAIQSLLGTSDKIRKYERALRAAGGTTEKVYKKQLESFASKLKMVKNRVQEVAIEIGKMLVPILETVMKKVDQAVDWWDSLTKAQKKNILTMSAMAAAIGPALAGLSTFVWLIGSVVAGVGFLVTPMGVITAGIVAFVSSLVGKDGLSKAWDVVKQKFDQFMSGDFSFIEGIFDPSDLKKTGENIRKGLGDVFKKVKGWIEPVIEFSKKWYDRLLTIAEVIWDRVVPAVAWLLALGGSLIDWWRDLGKEEQDNIIFIADLAIGIMALVAAIDLAVIAFAPLLVAAGGLLTFAANVVPAFVGVTAAVAVLSEYFMGRGGLSDAITGSQGKLDDFVTSSRGFVTNFSENMEKVTTWLQDNWQIVLDNMASMWVQFWINLAHNAIQSLVFLNELAKSPKKFIDAFSPKNVFGEIFGGIQNVLSGKQTTEEAIAGFTTLGDVAAQVGLDLLKISDGFRTATENASIIPFTDTPEFNLNSAAQNEIIKDLMGNVEFALRRGRGDQAKRMIELSTEFGHITKEMSSTFLQDTKDAYAEVWQSIIDRRIANAAARAEESKYNRTELDKTLRFVETIIGKTMESVSITKQFTTTGSSGTGLDDLRVGHTPIIIEQEFINTIDPEALGAAATSSRAGKQSILNIVGKDLHRGGTRRTFLRRELT